MSKLHHALEQHGELLKTGTVLSIDPSSGSQNSQPGYAIFEKGKLQDSGIIRIKARVALYNRLYELAEALRHDFIKPDLLITEGISIIMSGSGFAGPGMVSLQRAIGVVQSCFSAPCLEVAPVTWRKYIPSEYKKTDENDAIMIGAACFFELGEDSPVPPTYNNQLGGELNAKKTNKNNDSKNSRRPRKKT